VIDTSALSDVQVLACTLYGEARSETPEGILAVACVIRNRVNLDLKGDKKPDWWGEGYTGVCLKPMQFSCWSPKGGEGNYNKLAALVAGLKSGPVADPRYLECAWIATGVIKGWVRDVTFGADHYYAPKAMQPPSWAKGFVPLNNIHPFGRTNHLFYRLTPLVTAKT
jgi:N-acetylmuramoyl-L-alanine amidase